MDLSEEVRLYSRTTEEGKTQLRAVNAAHSIVVRICIDKHPDWKAWLPIPFGWNIWWNAYLKTQRVAKYLYQRRIEAMKENQRAECPERVPTWLQKVTCCTSSKRSR